MRTVTVHVDTSVCYVIEPIEAGAWRVAVYGYGHWRTMGRHKHFVSVEAASAAIGRYDCELRELAWLHTGTLDGLISELNRLPHWNNQEEYRESLKARHHENGRRPPGG